MLSTTIGNLIEDLNPRKREILSCRFGLESKERKTLADLGEKYDITRERVRQIEAEAMRRVKEEAQRERLTDILNRIFNHLDNLGGVRKEEILLTELQSIFGDKNLHHWHLRFLGELVNQPLYHLEDEEHYSFWYLKENHKRILDKFLNYLKRLITPKKEDLIVRGKFHNYLVRASRASRIPDFTAINYASVSRRFKINPFGDFGLADWEEVDPRTMGSKAYLVIKKIDKPLHFREVAEEINKAGFDEKKALPQTIHNELIKDPRFVLVGRGTYGLREQGYFPGTAREVIKSILKKKGAMSAPKIIEAVSKHRFLEKNTILLNLQNKKYFRRLADGRYTVIR